METSRTLYLILKKEFFEQIKNGVKTSEFREYKQHWKQKLMKSDGSFKTYDLILFQNGYHSYAPRIWVEFKGIKIKKKKRCFFNWEKVFEIELGKILKEENT